MKVAPFYSLSRGMAVEQLWHDNDECEIGQSIPLADRQMGTDHVLKHCQYCQLLNQPRPASRAAQPPTTAG